MLIGSFLLGLLLAKRKKMSAVKKEVMRFGFGIGFYLIAIFLLFYAQVIPRSYVCHTYHLYLFFSIFIVNNMYFGFCMTINIR
ncbi:hypothetical protein PUN28_017003 [Cardiocondyla obscurior]|uniref:Uncharacterized protein n=1 Tax=Cardiocondyla obscurior TaxID=286306 RepID=A0AAW2EJW2_9HYME